MEKFNEIEMKYKHFTERKTPFEDEIIDVIPDTNWGINYSDRDRWLKNLYFITSKGYYIKYTDFYASNVNLNDETGNKILFNIYLDGVLKAASVYAFYAEIENTIRFIIKCLAYGKICVSKYQNKYKFIFTLPYYSWIDAEDRNN